MSLRRRACVLVFVCWLAAPAAARGDDAIVLPRGRSLTSVENLYYIPTSDRFGPHGNVEDLAGSFNERSLDSSVFPLLHPLDPFVGGRASIGDSRLHFRYHYDIVNIQLAHGVTDRLTLGVEIPYYWVHNSVQASVNSAPGSSANVGLRTGPGLGPCGGVSPVLPLACPNTRRFTTEDVQRLLGPGLPGIPGFGFKRIQDFTDDGVGDIQAGAKYQFWRSQDFRLAATAGARFPTGRQDDPDDLADMSWSSGAYGIFLRSHNDWIVSNLWKDTPTPATGALPAAGDVVLDGTFRYEWVLPDHVTLRVGDANTLTTNREYLSRDLGDRFEFEGSAQYYFTSALSFTSVYRYGFKLEDRFSGHRGFPTQVLSQDTDSTEQILLFRLNYSTLPLYQQKRFPLPIDVALSYRNRFAGSGPRAGGSPSQVLKTEFWSLRLQMLF